MTPVRKNEDWLPSIFSDFFDNGWMLKANAIAPVINDSFTSFSYI